MIVKFYATALQILVLSIEFYSGISRLVLIMPNIVEYSKTEFPMLNFM
jgi:hypothetical protein